MQEIIAGETVLEIRADGVMIYKDPFFYDEGDWEIVKGILTELNS